MACGPFHAKMGTIKDRNSMDLTEAEDIKKRWQEYTELYKKDLHDPDNDDAMKVLHSIYQLHSICQHIWKSQQWPQDWKRSVSIPIPEKGNAKECSNYSTNELTSHARK